MSSPTAEWTGGPGPIDAGARDSRSRRVAVTIGSAAAVLVAAHLPLPQLDTHVWQEAVAWYGAWLGPLSLGMGPLVAGFLLVEFVAAVVPRWRALRDGSVADRARLDRAAWAAAVAVAAVQAWGMAVQLGALRDLRGEPLLAPGWLPTLSVAVTLVAGTFAAGGLALFISRRGLGNGFAVVLAAWGVEGLAGAGIGTLRGPRPPWSDVSLLVLLAVAVVVPLVAFRRRSERRTGAAIVPVPTCGLTVLGLWPGILELAYLAARWLGADASRLWGYLSGESRWAWIRLAVVLAMALPLGRLFVPRDAVEATWQRAGFPQVDGEGAAAARRVLRSVHLRSLALVGGIAALPLLAEALGAGDVPSSGLLVDLLTAGAVSADLVGEWNARRAGSPLVAIRPVSRAYAVEPILRALTAAGIPAHARTRHCRSLFHFFAPFAPIEILVARERAEEADAIVASVVVPARV